MRKRIACLIPLALVICIMMVGSLAGCDMLQPLFSDSQPEVTATPSPVETSAAPSPIISPSPAPTPWVEPPPPAAPGQLEVTVVDVGHGDCIYVKSPSGKVMLIDAGESTAWDQVRDFLDYRGVSRIDVLVASHPHTDHIGAMDSVVKHYDIGEVYMPEKSHTTDDFANLVKAMQKKDLTATSAKAGMTIALDKKLKCSILAPIGKEYKDINDYSIVLKITYGKTSFLLAADATKVSDTEMVKKYGTKLKADVLKVAHHGNEDSSSPAFLAFVKPEYAAISEKDIREYADPQARLDSYRRFTDIGATVFRTDANGAITFYSDGKTVTVKTAR